MGDAVYPVAAQGLPCAQGFRVNFVQPPPQPGKFSARIPSFLAASRPPWARAGRVHRRCAGLFALRRFPASFDEEDAGAYIDFPVN